MEFTPHTPMQQRALYFDTPLCVFAAGIQSGKTKVGSIWMKIQNHKFTDPTDNFLIIAPTYKILSQSTLPPYLQAMEGYGDFSKSDMTLKIHGGGTVYMRTGTDPDSIVGITNIRALWGDEAGLFSLYFSENIAARAAFRSAQTLYTTSPYTLNWIFKQIILPKMKNPEARPDATLIQMASWENPYFPKDVIDRNRATMDPRRFNAMFGGEWQRIAGMVYDCFDETENQCESFALPTGTRYYAGVDWGYVDPFVLKVRAITPTGMHYGVSEFYKSGMTISQILEVARQKKTVYGIERFYCDPSQPGFIEEFNRNGLPAVGANNDIRVGIDRHYELIKTRKYKLFKGSSPHTIDEIEVYHYPSEDDLGPNQDAKEKVPVDQNNHCMDADRYLTIETFHGSTHRLSPKVPEEGPKRENQFQRLERLKKRKNFGGGTESWS